MALAVRELAPEISGGSSCRQSVTRRSSGSKTSQDVSPEFSELRISFQNSLSSVIWSLSASPEYGNNPSERLFIATPSTKQDIRTGVHGHTARDGSLPLVPRQNGRPVVRPTALVAGTD